MKQAILTNWSFIRVIYLVLGLTVMIHASFTGEWFGIIFGGYFAAMGLFGFGCASGNCFGGSCAIEPERSTSSENADQEN